MCHMFFIAEKYDITSYTDDKTLCSGDHTTHTTENVVLNIEKLSKIILQ